MGKAPTGRPRVNIVVRTKNRTTLLARALDDILAQKFSDWVVTVVNDGGDAAPVDALFRAREAAFAQRAKLLHVADSLGMEAAANLGIERIATDYVAIHDDDDTWHPDFLATTVDWLDANPAAPAVAVRTEIIWEQLSGSTVKELSREVFLPGLQQVTLFDLLRFNTSVPISMTYRRADLDSVGKFDSTLNVAGDWDCNLRLAARGVIGFLPTRVLAYWHQRPSAQGDLGNSVIGLREEHGRLDRLIRDRALRSYVEEDGAGLPLYLTRFLDDRFDELNRRIEHLERLSFGSYLRRVKSLVRRVFGREGSA